MALGLGLCAPERVAAGRLFLALGPRLLSGSASRGRWTSAAAHALALGLFVWGTNGGIPVLTRAAYPLRFAFFGLYAYAELGAEAC